MSVCHAEIDLLRLARKSDNFDTYSLISGRDYPALHIDHIVKIGGIECVAFGSDFDGTFTPNCVPDCSFYPSFLNYLSKNGYSKSDLSAIASENALRVFKDTWN